MTTGWSAAAALSSPPKHRVGRGGRRRSGRQAGESSPPRVLGSDTDGVVVDKVGACGCVPAVPPGSGPVPTVGHARIQAAIPLVASTPRPSRQPSV